MFSCREIIPKYMNPPFPMSRFSISSILAIALCVLGANNLSATSIGITTTQGGGNTKINSTNTAIWNFTITEAGAAAGLSVVSGNFSIRRDNGVTQPIVFSFYRGFSTNGSISTELLGSASVTGIDTTTYTQTLFNITPTSNLTQGAYSFTLSSTGVGNNAYNFKGNTSVPPVLVNSSNGTAISSTLFADAGPNPTPYVTPTPTPTPGPTPVPEPGQVAASILVAAGIAVYWFLKRKKQAPSV